MDVQSHLMHQFCNCTVYTDGVELRGSNIDGSSTTAVSDFSLRSLGKNPIAADLR